MFGFLKKKLKDAVSKFTKKAAAEVVEEKVEDEAVIEAAKREERELLAEAVTEIPETPKEKAEHEKEAKESAPKKKPRQPGAPAKRKPVPTPQEREEKKEKKKEKKKEEGREERRGEEKRRAPKPAREQAPEEAPKKEPEERPKKGFLKKLFTKKPAIEEPERAAPQAIPKEEKRAVSEERAGGREEKEAVSEEKPEAQEEKEEVGAAPKRGLFTKLKESFTKKSLSPEKFDELFWELEVALLENNVAVEVIEKLKADLKRELTSGKVSRLGLDDLIVASLRKSVSEVLNIPGFDLVKTIKRSQKRPFVITFIGVNGSGKTTTLAKVANKFQEEGLSVVIAASDTFRAAAIDQLKEHADRLSIKLISQGYGADPAAVAYDAIEHAKAKAVDVVMIDTAGRLHSNTNLMAELEKVVRVANPDLKIFIGESITGNDCVEQAKEFDRLVGIDAIILSKADVDEKGGAALSVSWVTKKPILYLGVGQAYGDLKRFDKEEIIKNLGL